MQSNWWISWNVRRPTADDNDGRGFRRGGGKFNNSSKGKKSSGEKGGDNFKGCGFKDGGSGKGPGIGFLPGASRDKDFGGGFGKGLGSAGHGVKGPGSFGGGGNFGGPGSYGNDFNSYGPPGGSGGGGYGSGLLNTGW